MNLWWVIQFSAAASVVAAVILGLKLLFHDKLDARWHYLIWLVLLVRMLVPVQTGGIRTPVSLFETIPVLRWLALCELAVHKAGLAGVVKALAGIYLAGAAAFLLYDLLCYLILRLRIAGSKETGQEGTGTMRRASQRVCQRVEETAEKYGLKSCGRICVQDAPTPYVCGLWKPALVLTEGIAHRLEAKGSAAPAPDGTGDFDPDEAVIVHELLHGKYKDVLINLLLHLVRALNWFNPFLWYVTSVIQNDSEALCDQRVLECLERGRERESGYERDYGLLLIRMAEGKQKNPAKAGTSNMANSFRNMKTRIGRIADFKKVPSGIGIVTLCITLMLSVSGIGYCREQSWQDFTDIKSEWELQAALLHAQLYEAKTVEEALYLYLAAMRSGNPLYLMAVMPEDARLDYESWMLEGYAGGRLSQASGNWMHEWEENAYFPQMPFSLTDFTVYNLSVENPDHGTATVLVNGRTDESRLWELEILREEGWRIRRRQDEKIDMKSFEEPALFAAIGQGGDFRVEVKFWNEGVFDALNAGFYAWDQSAASAGLGMSGGSAKESPFPQEFSMEYKMSASYLVYTGDEDLSGSRVGVVILEEGIEEADCEAQFRAAQGSMSVAGEGSGAAWCNISGEELMNGKRVTVSGGGSGPDRWTETESAPRRVWVFVDGVCAEEFETNVLGAVWR